MVEVGNKKYVSLVIPRNHVKGNPRPGDMPPLVSLMDGLSGPLSPQPSETSGALTGTASTTAAVPSFSFKDLPPHASIPNGYLNGAARGR